MIACACCMRSLRCAVTSRLAIMMSRSYAPKTGDVSARLGLTARESLPKKLANFQRGPDSRALLFLNDFGVLQHGNPATLRHLASYRDRFPGELGQRIVH